MLIEKFTVNIIKRFVEPLKIPSAFSWQTLILLSIFSCLMSFLATNEVRDIIATFGWIFLIFGTSWATTDNPLKIFGFSIGPWITGALVCIFVFGSWNNIRMPQIALICWPPTGAVLASARYFFEDGMKLKTPPPVDRQRVVILLCSNLLISCWFQFYFETQNLVQQYPTLLADNFNKSAFVTKLQSQPEVTPRGTLILNLMESLLQRELGNKRWSQVERWLLEQERETRLAALKNQVQKQLPPAEEDWLWNLKSKVSTTNSGYNLQLQAVWEGPGSESGTYDIKKTCQIIQTDKQRRAESGAVIASTPVSKVNCGVAK